MLDFALYTVARPRPSAARLSPALALLACAALALVLSAASWPRLAGAERYATALVASRSAGGAAALIAEVSSAVVAPVAQASAPESAGRWPAVGVTFVSEAQDWDAATLVNVVQALALIPAPVRAALGNPALGEPVVLVNRQGRTLAGKQPYGGPANFYYTNDGRNELILFPGQSVLTVMHELGHAYNLRSVPPGRYALVLLQPEMQNFMAAAGWRVLSPVEEVQASRDHLQVRVAYEGADIWAQMSHRDPLEDFANSFALYFFDPEALRAKSEARFMWFEANVGR